MVTLTQEPFGTLPDGRAVDLYTLDNGRTTVKVTNFGGIITSIMTPDRNGNRGEICLGFSTLADYLGPHPFFGALVGRYANRIANGRFTLNGQTYQLAINNGPNCLHGGNIGFDKRLWHAQGAADGQTASVRMHYQSPAGEENFPGTLSTQVTYTLREDDVLQLDYAASTDADTVINLTNHAYFNLSGADHVYAHLLQVGATHYQPADENLIPNGPAQPIAGSIFDFREPTPVGKTIHEAHGMLTAGRGFDVGFWVDGPQGALNFAARVIDPVSGRMLEVATTEPDCHFYSGGFLDGSLVGHGGKRYGQHSGFCLETQHFPDSPNQPHLPSTLLRPGETHTSTTLFGFRLA
jgi:aldose 1-epimerase